MKSILKRINIFTYISVASISLALLFYFVIHIKPTAIAFGVLSLACLGLLVRESRLLNDAKLIKDNVIFEYAGDVGETIVSTFGILNENKVYRWGCDGVLGPQLCAIEINKKQMNLTFGNKARTIKVELLHGITEREAILDIAKRLLYETGVIAEISEW